MRVVIAEDEALIRMDLAEMLADEGYDVVGQAGDGQQAVDLAEQLRPDLVILDVKMPVLDGIAAAERIAGQRIAPVVMLTAFSQRDLVERARDAGAMAYLVKPFSQSDLAPAIEMAVSRFAEVAALEAEVADLEDRLETRKAVERAKNVLQRDLGLSEPDAFRWIQKTAMDLRLTMRQVADGVITHGPGLAGRLTRCCRSPRRALRLRASRPATLAGACMNVPREARVSPGRTVLDLGRPWRRRRRSPRPASPVTRARLGLLLAVILLPFALVAAASPASAETCFAGSADKGCISGTIRTEVDVVEGVDVNVTGPGGFDETATSDDRGKWSVTVTELGEYTATIDEETLPEERRRHRQRGQRQGDHHQPLAGQGRRPSACAPVTTATPSARLIASSAAPSAGSGSVCCSPWPPSACP